MVKTIREDKYWKQNYQRKKSYTTSILKFIADLPKEAIDLKAKVGYNEKNSIKCMPFLKYFASPDCHLDLKKQKTQLYVLYH